VSTGFSFSNTTNTQQTQTLIRGSDVIGATLPNKCGGAILGSFIRGAVNISGGSIVEFSNILTPTSAQSSIGANSIVSQVYYTSETMPLLVPPNTLLVSIMLWDWDRLVKGGAPVTTSCFVGLNDDLKSLTTLCGEEWRNVKQFFNGWWWGGKGEGEGDDSLFNKELWGVFNSPKASVAFALSQLWQVKGDAKTSRQYFAMSGPPLRYTSIQQALLAKSASRIGDRHSPLR